MPLTALGFFLLFFLIAVVWRALLQHRRTGDYGVRVLRTERDRFQALASGLSLLGTATIVVSALLVLQGLLRIPGLYPRGPMFAAGVALCVTGIVTTVLSQLHMGSSWRIGVAPNERTQLVTTGMYRIVRNPIYTGITLFGIGMLLLVPNSYHDGALGALSPRTRGRKAEARNPLASRVRQLEGELGRTREELRKANLILDMQGKVAGLLGFSLTDGKDS